MQRLSAYGRLIRLHKPTGLLLLLWPTLWGLWIASIGQPTPKLLVIFLIGVLITRSAGCIINDLVDKDLDRFVSRTRRRPLVTGEITPTSAGLFLLVLAAIGLALLSQLNALSQVLSVIAVCLMSLYPFFKRVTYWPQAVLGITFGGWPVLMAFAAQSGHVPYIGYQLFLTASLWPLAYDTLYAIVDREEDRKCGIKSSALTLGSFDRYFIGLVQGLMFISMIHIGKALKLGQAYYISIGLGVLLVVYQQWLIRDRTPEACSKAFRQSHWVGAVLFFGIALSLNEPAKHHTALFGLAMH